MRLEIYGEFCRRHSFRQWTTDYSIAMQPTFYLAKKGGDKGEAWQLGVKMWTTVGVVNRRIYIYRTATGT